MKNSTDLVESPLKLYGLQNSKPTVNPGRRSTVMDLASATPLDGHDYRRKTHLHGTLETRHAIRHPTTIHTSPQPHDREQARSETVDTSKARNTLVFLNRTKWFKQVCWNSLAVVTQIGPAIRQHARVLRDIRLSSCEAEVYAASACAGELLGLAELFKELHYKVSVRLESGFRLGKTHSAAPRTRRIQTH